MKKATFLGTTGVMAALTLLITSCNSKDTNLDEEPVAAQEATTTGIRIAYVEIDSLMSQYKFCQDYALILQKKSNNARTTITTKGEQLQKAANNFQEKLNNNGFTSEAEAQTAYNAIQKSNQDLQSLQARLENELQIETAKYNEALMDSLQNFINDYNKAKKFDYILSKQGLNILYAAQGLDITDDVIKGLNKRYKPISDTKAEKK